MFSTGQGRKTDPVDAHSVALVGLRSQRLRTICADDATVASRLLIARREQLGVTRGQVINRIHRLLLELLPGGAKKHLSAAQAKALLGKVRPRDIAGKTRRRLAAELIVDLASLDAKIKAADKELHQLITATGSTPVSACLPSSTDGAVTESERDHAQAAQRGTRSALVAVGAVAPIVCLLRWRRLTAIDGCVAARTDDIVLLRQVSFLRPLPVPVVEQLAQGLLRRGLRAGEVVFHAGDTGDNFYIVADGTVQVLDQDRIVRTLATGDGFGEIALMGNTTRTMTVRAVGAVRLYGIGSADFLSAVTSIGDARSAAEATQWTYVAHAPGGAANAADAS